LKDLNSYKKSNIIKNNNISLININNILGINNNPNMINNNLKTNLMNNLNNQNDNPGDTMNLMNNEKINNLANINCKFQKDLNVNNLNIPLNHIGNLREEKEAILQTKRNTDFRIQEKQQVNEKGKLKEIEEKLNKIYSNGK